MLLILKTFFLSRLLYKILKSKSVKTVTFELLVLFWNMTSVSEWSMYVTGLGRKTPRELCIY